MRWLFLFKNKAFLAHLICYMLQKLSGDIIHGIILHLLRCIDKTSAKVHANVSRVNRALKISQQNAIFVIIKRAGIKDLKKNEITPFSLYFFAWIENVHLATSKFHRGIGLLDPETMCHEFEHRCKLPLDMRRFKKRNTKMHQKSICYITNKIQLIINLCRNFYYKVYFNNNIADEDYLGLWDEFISSNITKLCNYCETFKVSKVCSTE